MRILIAEDDPILAIALRRTLRQSGYAVDWVKDGGEADAALDTSEFDLLIFDINLSKLCGFEVLSACAHATHGCRCSCSPHSTVQTTA